MRCDRCGFENEPGAALCTACGNLLSPSEEPAASETGETGSIGVLPTEVIEVAYPEPDAPPPGLPPAPGAEPREPRPDRWPAIRRALLGIEVVGAAAFAVLAILDGRHGFLWTAVAFGAVPVLYGVAAAIRGRGRGLGLAVAGLLAPLLVVSAVVVLTNCENRLTPGADLSGCDLAGLDLAGLDLSEADLSGAELGGADLSGADLSGANLSGADLGRADLGGARLLSADLTGADLREANLDGARLVGSDLSGADLSGHDLSGLDLSGLIMRGANLTGASLSGATLIGTDLGEARLDGADLRQAEAATVVLDGAVLDEADLSGSRLPSADLSGASLAGAVLEGVDLEDARLDGADLSGAELRDVVLIGATGLSDEALGEVLGVGPDRLGVATADRAIRLEARTDVLQVLGAACRGARVADAAAFGGGARHLAVLVDGTGKQIDMSARLQELGWEPTAARFGQLVACVKAEQEITVEVCRYVTSSGAPGRPTRRVRFTREVRVVAARTGEVVLAETYEGSFPDQCPFSKTTFGTGGEDRIEGGRVGFDRFRGQLEGLVE